MVVALKTYNNTAAKQQRSLNGFYAENDQPNVHINMEHLRNQYPAKNIS